MARRRGFFAEWQHQSALAARERQRGEAANAREYARLEREMERSQRAEATLRARMAKEGVAAAKATQVELTRLRHEAMQAEADALSAQLESRLSEIDGILAATLAVDDYVDLGALRKVAEHPPFQSASHAPLPLPAPIQPPPEPTFVAPEEPKGLGAMLGGKRKYQTVLQEAQTEFARRHQAWAAEASQVPMRQYAQMEQHARAEAERQQRLNADWAAYQQQSAEREVPIQRDNQRLDGLIGALAAGHPKAVEEYIGIVLGNSVYPEDLVSVEDYAYDAATRELRISLLLPTPDRLPTEKSFKYVKAKGEIVTTPQTLKEQRDRYTALVGAVALRTLHELWESDRQGHVATISLTGSVAHVDRATGRDVLTPLIALAAAREPFLAIDLARVDPAETLRHLNASVSKDPYGLAPANLATGVRGH